jgi:hypothetical protein
MSSKQIKLEKKLKREYARLSRELDKLHSNHAINAVTGQYRKGEEWVGPLIRELNRRQFQIVTEIANCVGYCHMPLDRILDFDFKYNTNHYSKWKQLLEELEGAKK